MKSRTAKKFGISGRKMGMQIYTTAIRGANPDPSSIDVP
jgi:hypothetical protein